MDAGEVAGLGHLRYSVEVVSVCCWAGGCGGSTSLTAGAGVGVGCQRVAVYRRISTWASVVPLGTGVGVGAGGVRWLTAVVAGVSAGRGTVGSWFWTTVGAWVTGAAEAVVELFVGTGQRANVIAAISAAGTVKTSPALRQDGGPAAGTS